MVGWLGLEVEAVWWSGGRRLRVSTHSLGIKLIRPLDHEVTNSFFAIFLVYIVDIVSDIQLSNSLM